LQTVKYLSFLFSDCSFHMAEYRQWWKWWRRRQWWWWWWWWGGGDGSSCGGLDNDDDDDRPQIELPISYGH